MSSLVMLYRLQQTDKQLDEITQEIGSLDFVPHSKVDLDEAEKGFEASRNRRRDAERLLKDAELELATLETHRKEVNRKLTDGKITNAKELSQLERDLEQLDKRREKLDDRVLLEMEKLDKIEQEFRAKEAAWQEKKQQYEEETQKYGGRKEALSKQLEELKLKRDSLTQSIDGESLDSYIGLKEKKGGVAIVKIQKNVCGACFMLVPESSIQKVKVFELERCSSCGRILYFDKEM